LQLHKLLIKEQPVPEWFKDEGGKGNVLRFEVESPIQLHEVSGLRVRTAIQL
jgi:hypothetical protein